MGPPPETLVWASEVIGFISFGITLLTLLGVYRDLISTIRNAPTQITLQLGNLRQEIEAERLVLRKRCREGDEFNVFRPSGRLRSKSRKRTNEVVHLLMKTMDKLWLEFKTVERPFLIKSGRRAEAVKRGDFWGESDIDEKIEARLPGTPKEGRAGKRTNVMGMEEANVGLDERYYRTDLTHRFIWWQSKGNADSLAEQVQRVQIRRIERDVFECDELMKRLIRKMDSGGDGGGWGSGSETDDPGPRGGGGISRRGSKKSVDGRGKRMYDSRETEIIRVPAKSRAGSLRESSHARSISRVRSISPPRRRSPRLRERTEESTASPVEQRPSNTARRRAARDSRVGDTHEHEVVRPGRDGTYTIDVSNTRNRPGLRDGPGQSYYRERAGGRDGRRNSDPRDRNRSRARYDDD